MYCSRTSRKCFFEELTPIFTVIEAILFINQVLPKKKQAKPPKNDENRGRTKKIARVLLSDKSSRNFFLIDKSLYLTGFYQKNPPKNRKIKEFPLVREEYTASLDST